MKKFLKTTALICACSFSPISAHSAVLFNDDFQNGGFSNWSMDSDSLGDPLSSSDFSNANNAVQIQADYANNQVLFVNTLYQKLPLFTNSNERFLLSFDWALTGDAAMTDEIFGVGIVPPSTVDYYDSTRVGFLFEQTNYGSGTFSAMLDSSFANQVGWILEFQLLRGFDGLGSSLQIDNILFQSVPTVPEPPEMLLLSIGLIALYGVKRKAV